MALPAGAARASIRGKTTIRGKDRLIRKLKAISDDFVSDAEDILLVGAESIRAKAEMNAPRSNKSKEHLADNIIKDGLTGETDPQASAGDIDVDKGVAIVGVGPSRDFFYGLFTEIGTKDQPAQPWLRPAFDSQKDNAERDIIKELNRVIKKHTIAGL